MDPKMILLALEFLNSSAGQRVAEKIANGTGSLGESILKGIGGKKYVPTYEDVRDFADLAGAFRKQQSETRQPLDNDEILQQAEARMQNAKELYEGPAGDIFIDSPAKMATKIGINALSNGVKAAGGIAENNSNRLAAAILEGYRQHSDAQDQRYGPSARDKANAMWAQNKMRTGTNKNIIGNALGNTLDRGLNMYEMQDLAAKQLAMTEATGRVPSALYDLFSRQQTAQSRGQN